MHYYKFNIGDYARSTRHLSNEEDLAYRRLLDMYYETEAPIPLETQWVARRLRLGIDVVTTVLEDMFKKSDDGWTHTRCDDDIAEYHRNAEKNRANGKRGGRPKTTDENPVGSQWDASGNPNHKPLTNNHKPKTISNRSLPKKAGALFDLKEASQGMVHDVWMRKLKDRNITDDEINEAPDVWKRIAVEQCLIWRTEGGHYILRG